MQTFMDEPIIAPKKNMNARIPGMEVMGVMIVIVIIFVMVVMIFM